MLTNLRIWSHLSDSLSAERCLFLVFLSLSFQSSLVCQAVIQEETDPKDHECARDCAMQLCGSDTTMQLLYSVFN